MIVVWGRWDWEGESEGGDLWNRGRAVGWRSVAWYRGTVFIKSRLECTIVTQEQWISEGAEAAGGFVLLALLC